MPRPPAPAAAGPDGRHGGDGLRQPAGGGGLRLGAAGEGPGGGELSGRRGRAGGVGRGCDCARQWTQCQAGSGPALW